METWDVAKSQRVCAVSGRTLATGEVYFSALKEINDGFARLDYAPEVWVTQNAAEFFSFWRSKVPTETARKKNQPSIDNEAFYQFMQSLLNPATPERPIFRYLLALILVRKRVYRLDEIATTPAGEILYLYDTRQKSELAIPVPIAAPEDLTAAQEELNKLLE